MLGVVVGIAGFVAFAAWATVVISMVQVARLAPAGSRVAAFVNLGWWRFDKVRSIAGAAVEPHLKRYTWGFLGFFAALAVTMIVGIASSLASRNGSAVATTAVLHSEVHAA